MVVPIPVHGPYIDDLRTGQKFTDSPSVTLTDSLNTAYQSIVGSRLQLVSDHTLARAVTGAESGLANQALVWNVAMGQSTGVTGRVVANLFYRGLDLHRVPHLGDTLSTITTVEKMRANTLKPGRRPTGMVQLRVQTTDQVGRTVLDFHRCAMLPFSTASAAEAFPYRDDVSVVDIRDERPRLSIEEWDLDAWRAHVSRMGVPPIASGDHWMVTAGDVVTSAPELARLTMNTAAVHHDKYATGSARRLVYGGHTIGIAFHHLVRCVPQLLAVTGWDFCDHTGPVFEDDTLTSDVSIVDERATAGGVRELTVRILTASRRKHDEPVPVLDWQLRVLIAV